DNQLASVAVAGEHIENTRRQAHVSRELGEEQRREWRELGWLDDDRAAGRECRRDLPRQHQEREVPRNNLSDDADAAVTGKLRVEQLGPAGVVVEMPRDERDVDVSRLANRLPVVHALENGEETRVLLDAARKRVEPA